MRESRPVASKSPLHSFEYNHESDEIGLLRPVRNRNDAGVARIARKFANSAARERSRIRKALSDDEQYVLFTFCLRSCVFAIRNKRPQDVFVALSAVTMMTVDRMDYRDVYRVAEDLCYTANRLKMNVGVCFGDAKRRADRKVARILGLYLKAWKVGETPSKPSRHTEAIVQGVVGFIESDRFDYRPSFDLTNAAVEIADALTDERYYPYRVEIATHLPPVWIKGADANLLEIALKKTTACTSVSMQSRESRRRSRFGERLYAWVLEMANETVVDELLQMSRQGGSEFDITIGVAEKRVFTLIVASSLEYRVKTIESKTSVKQFASKVKQVLRRYIR